ncbi:MAG: ribonuclease III [Proteobacteria bacterium]|nr:ribonuclease III [Pseudomonadota bacterium]
MESLEENLKYTFKNSTFLKMALTHPSALPPGQGVNFERLEFLGDRVLGLVIASWLFEEFPQESEGNMAKWFAGLVQKETLVIIAESIHLDKSMVMKHEKSSSQDKRLETLLADGCEALIGALYLDGGLDSARLFIRHFWKDYFNNVHNLPHDPKSMLQEWVQARGKNHPVYKVLSSTGPAHSPCFIIEVHVDGFEPIQGKGTSKRLAEKNAAKNLLKVIVSHE